MLLRCFTNKADILSIKLCYKLFLPLMPPQGGSKVKFCEKCWTLVENKASSSGLWLYGRLSVMSNVYVILREKYHMIYTVATRDKKYQKMQLSICSKFSQLYVFAKYYLNW